MTHIMENGNFDLVSFRALYSEGKNILTNKIYEHRMANQNSDKVLFQPDLGLYVLRPGKNLYNYIVKDNYLWNKCIKTKLYQNALNNLGKKRFSRYMIYEEDRAIIYVLFNISKSIKYISKYGILIILTLGSVTKRRYPINEYFFSKLYFVDIVIDFSKETYENKKILVYLITHLLSMPKSNDFDNFDKINKNLFISCLNRIFNNNFISKEDKLEIKKKIKNNSLKKLFF